ncbi:MAG: hypothetical protein AAB375_00985 [Patescibacteria group bacterium]
MSESFLRESWQRVAEQEQEVTPEMRDLELYFDIRERSDGNEKIKAIMDRLDHDIAQYTEALFRSEREWVRRERGSGDNSSIEASDRNRRILHDSLIDTLNQLSRAYRTAGLDNKWRNMLGLDRDRLALWAMTIARQVMRTEEPLS